MTDQPQLLNGFPSPEFSFIFETHVLSVRSRKGLLAKFGKYKLDTEWSSVGGSDGVCWWLDQPGEESDNSNSFG